MEGAVRPGSDGAFDQQHADNQRWRLNDVDLQAHSDSDGTQVLHVAGEIDLAVADDLAEMGNLLLASEGCRTLVIDFADVTFLDSTGMSALVHIRNQAVKAHQHVDLRNVAPRVARVLRITGLDSVFQLP